ncbi:MAG: HD domain-containing protein [Chloroflexales bacterium]|nr:HD domain-containing protein [Chloroflexales bacterium]
MTKDQHSKQAPHQHAAITAILELLTLAERLKCELRHSWLSDGRRESVAEHTWQMALMAVVLHPHLEHQADLCRTLKMVLIHDLVEAEAGDVPFFETGARKEAKAAREQAAITRIRDLLPEPSGQEIAALWYEFEAGETVEAAFARALDNLEVQVQHNLADLSTWQEIEYDLVYTKMDRHCQHDAFLALFCNAVKQEAERKMKSAGLDMAAIRARADAS